MTENTETTSNVEATGDKNITGWQKLAVEVGRTFGVPTVLLLLISYWLLWQVTPPMVNMLQEFMKSTIETQAELAKTQADIAESQRQLVALVKEVSSAASEIVVAEKATQEFMAKVEQTHMTQLAKIEENNLLIKENNLMTKENGAEIKNNRTLSQSNNDILKEIKDKIKANITKSIEESVEENLNKDLMTITP